MIEYFIGTASGIKAANGRIKPKYGAKAVIAVAIMALFLIGFIFMLLDGLINMNFEIIIASVMGIIAFSYLLSINAYTQRSGDYYFELGSEGSLEGFKLSYKDKSVAVQYIIDENGKITFSDNNKLNCISYTDGSYMSNFIKYKILNYFCRWLSDNDLLSDKITVTFH